MFDSDPQKGLKKKSLFKTKKDLKNNLNFSEQANCEK